MHSADDEDGAGTVVAMVASAALCGLIWAAVVALVAWGIERPEAAVKVMAGGMLLAGACVVAFALERMEREP